MSLSRRAFVTAAPAAMAGFGLVSSAPALFDKGAPNAAGAPADIRVHIKDSEMMFFINESLLRRPVDQLLKVFVA